MSKEYLTNRQIALKVGGTPPSSYIDLFTAKEQAINFYGTIIDQTKLTSYPSGDFIVDDDIVKKSVFGPVFQLGTLFDDTIGNYNVSYTDVVNSQGCYLFRVNNSQIRTSPKNLLQNSYIRARFALELSFVNSRPSMISNVMTFKIHNGPYVNFTIFNNALNIYFEEHKVGNSYSINAFDKFVITAQLEDGTLVFTANGKLLYTTAVTALDATGFSVGCTGDFISAQMDVFNWVYFALH